MLFNKERLLILAPHTDDGEFGCGGLIAKSVEEKKAVFYVAFSTARKSVPDGYPEDILEIEVREAKSRHLARNRQAAPPMQRMPHRFMLSVINIEDGSGLELAEVSFSTSFLAQFLAYFDQYALSHSLWSPDSQQVVLPIVADGENQIVVISTRSGRMNQIGNGLMAFWSKQ